MSYRRILALDIATNTGWAVDPPGPAARDAKPITGTFSISFDGDEFGPGFARFAAWLEEQIVVHAPEVVAFEAPIPRPTGAQFNTSRILLGLAAIAELVASERHVDCFETHIQTVRKHFTGWARCDKSDVALRCRQLGWDVRTLDAADACAVWDYARHELARRRISA